IRAEQSGDRSEESGGGAQRNERVHGGLAVAEGFPGGLMKGPADKEKDRRGERELDERRKMKGLNKHQEVLHEEGQDEEPAKDQTPGEPSLVLLVHFGRALLGGEKFGGVTGFDDRRFQERGIAKRGVGLDIGFLGGEVDR